MVFHKHPSTPSSPTCRPTATGLNPLLQNLYMATHPPSLYIGFVGMTIPFAFGMAALITGHLDDSWLRAVRRWMMIGWLFLSLGLTLGMLWAYEELGWGGYWGWDPVENAGAAAVVHRDRVPALGDGPGAARHAEGVERLLVIVTFLLTIFGTFMTRSGVVQSVHAFGEDPELAWLFIGFMVVDPRSFSFGLVIYRLPLLRARQRARLVGVARVRVPGEQLDPAVLGVLRPVRDAVPDAERGGHRAAAHRRAAVLQQVDGCRSA